MKKQALALFMAAAIGLRAVSPAWGAQPPVPPANVKMGALDAFAFWFAKKLVIDIDAALKTQGIEAKVCTFRPKSAAEDFSARGLGPCLYKDFLKSMRTDALAGVVYTWIQDRQGRYHPIEIQWRPPRGGWWQLIAQVVEMRLEKPLYSVRELIWGENSAGKMRYSEFLGGDLKIILPADPEALAVLASRGGEWAKSYLAKVHSIDLHLAPVTSEKGKVVYDGALIINHQASADGRPTESTKVALRTNVNVVILKRPFFVKAKIRQNGGRSDALPVVGSEVLP